MRLPDWEALSLIAAVVGLAVTTWLGLRQLKVSRSTATFASISVFLAVVVLGYAFPKLDGTNPEDQPVPSSDQALPTNEQTVPTSDQAAPTSSQDVPTTPQCRSDYVDTPHAPVKMRPCITLVGDRLKISAEVVSEEEAEVVVWVWLYDSDAQYRPEYSVKSCVYSFDTAGETKRCEKAVTPDRSGRYQAAMAAELAESAGERPRDWDEPLTEFTGTQNGTAIPWSP